jgi:transglutaminase-like putative cysteine protease
MLKPCFRSLNQPRIISAFFIVAAFAAALLLNSPPNVAADSAPDWLRATAQEKLPTYADDPIAVVLFDESQVAVQDNGKIEVRHRVAYKLLRPEARSKYGYAAVNFDNETKVSSFKAWTIAADGREFALSEKDALETALSGDAFFSDDRAKVLKFPEANVGSIVGYEYVQEQRPFILEDNWSFQRTIPVKRARFVLQLPRPWEFSASWFNYPEQKPQMAGTSQRVWELTDLPAVEEEPDMPPRGTIEGHLGVKYFPPDGSQRGRITASWKNLGLWYYGLTQPSLTSSPQIKQKVADLTAGIPDPVGKIRALTEYMQRQIRYVAIEIGIGGFQPHSAADVFNNQYGDCKDKATLLLSMLREIGVDAYYVIIDTDRGVVRPDFPSIHFNHVILAIRLPDKPDAPGLYATVNDAKLGELLLFDPTNPYVPLGYLPSYLQDSYGLLVSPDGGDLLLMPLLPPSSNRLLRTAKFSLNPAGDLTGDVHELTWGAPAEQDREMFLKAQPAKRADVVQSFLSGFLNNFTLTAASLGNLEKYDQTFALNYKFVSPGYASSAGDMLFVRPRVLGDKYTSLLDLFAEKKSRKYPIEFEEATRQDDVFDISLPVGYAIDGLPKPVEANCDYATYRSETNVSDGVLHYHRTFEIKDVMIPTEKLPVIRDFLQQIAADQQSAAVLRRVTP